VRKWSGEGTKANIHTHTHSASPCRRGSDRNPIHVCGEGGKLGEKEWWEGNKRERENGEKHGGGERWEDDMRERDGT